MADFLSLLLGLPSVISNFSGSASPYTREQEQLSARMAQYAQASADPTNPLYQQTYNKFQDQNKANLAQVIAEAQGQNRMANQMGRTPLFSQGRGGETLFRSLMQGYQNSGAQSDQQTRASLKDASGQTGQALAGYNSASPFKALKNYQQDVMGYEGIGKLLGAGGGGGGYLQDGAPMQQQSPWGQINWNTPRQQPSPYFSSGIF